MVPRTFNLSADQLVLIATFIMLMCFNSAVCLGFHRDGREDQGIGRDKHDNSRSDADDAGEHLPGSAVMEDFSDFCEEFFHGSGAPYCCRCLAALMPCMMQSGDPYIRPGTLCESREVCTCSAPE